MRSILWFRQDLRLHDNEALLEAIRNSDDILPVYIFDKRQFRPLTRYGIPKTSTLRTQFLIESVLDLRRQLQALGTDLIIRTGRTEELIHELTIQHKVHYIYCNRERTREEVEVQDKLEQRLWTIGREMRYSRGKMLYYTSDLPFPVTHCPDSFAVFRKETEHLIPIRMPLDTPEKMPSLPEDIEPGNMPPIDELLSDSGMHAQHHFPGGETAGLAAMKDSEMLVPVGFAESDGSILTPWIALGCLSPKKVYYHSRDDAKTGGDILQSLLYRDYLRLMGKKYGDRIFYKSGIRSGSYAYKTDEVALANWQEGKTGVPIVDAAMKQLIHTGWLPDSLRKLVSGYFIKMLNLDWRLGAAWFEYRLIDYDPCTNWVSWLNMAGLGPDTREDRVINYDAVGKRLDPEGKYISAWS